MCELQRRGDSLVSSPMARDEHERENLLRDATAFAYRLELRNVAGNEAFVGIRKSGAASVYLNQDPVYHFTSDFRLRRAFVANRLLKAEAGQLVAMRRVRTEGEVHLVSRELTSKQSMEVSQNATELLGQVLTSLQEDDFEFVGKFPEDADIVAMVTEWLQKVCAEPLQIAHSPHAK